MLFKIICYATLCLFVSNASLDEDYYEEEHFCNTDDYIRAAKRGDIKTMKKCLLDENDINEHDEIGRTALHWAVAMHQYESIKYLLKNGAAVNEYTWGTRATPLHLAVNTNDEKLVNLLLDKEADCGNTDQINFTPLFIAASYGHYEIGKRLLQANCSANATSYDGWTALHELASRGNTDKYAKLAELLLARGAKADAKTERKWTPLHEAASRGNELIAELLATRLDKTMQKDVEGWTPFHIAVIHGHIKVVNAFLKIGVAVDSRAFNGWTPMMAAAGRDQVDIMKLLYSHGADVNAQDHQGRTALHEAIVWENIKSAEFLIQNKADTTIVDLNHKSMLDFAEESGNLPIIELIKGLSTTKSSASTTTKAPITHATLAPTTTAKTTTTKQMKENKEKKKKGNKNKKKKGKKNKKNKGKKRGFW